MYATPMTRAPLGKRQLDGTPRALLARESSWRGWGWHFLAIHHRPHGWVEQSLGGFLYNLFHQMLMNSAIHVVDRGTHCHLLLIFSNKEAVVARCNQPESLITRMLDSRFTTITNKDTYQNVPGSLVFAPILLRVSNNVVFQSNKTGRQMIARIQTDAETIARIEQDMEDALAVLDRIGPVKKPWDAQPGEIVAPWAMGRATNPTLELAVKGAIHTLLPSLRADVWVQVVGMAVDDAGVPKGTPSAAVDSVFQHHVDSTQWNAFLAWVGTLHLQGKAGIPFAHCIGQEAQGYAKLGRDSKRVPAPIVRTTAHTASAHHKMEALQAYHATL
jgi:hypothetical protein